MLLLIAAAITIPLGLDLYLPVPEENPITAEKIELVRRLFFDRRLSRDESISCSSCHDPGRAFSDGRSVAVGVFGRNGRRNSPALINRSVANFPVVGPFEIDPLPTFQAYRQRW